MCKYATDQLHNAVVSTLTHTFSSFQWYIILRNWPTMHQTLKVFAVTRTQKLLQTQFSVPVVTLWLKLPAALWLRATCPLRALIYSSSAGMMEWSVNSVSLLLQLTPHPAIWKSWAVLLLCFIPSPNFSHSGPRQLADASSLSPAIILASYPKI